jgi:hypothetical protein
MPGGCQTFLQKMHKEMRGDRQTIVQKMHSKMFGNCYVFFKIMK